LLKGTNVKSPINTKKQDPLLFLAEAMMLGSSDGVIERQEAQGQCSFVGSDTLPTEMGRGEKEALEKFGVKFLGPVEGDAIFQYVELPEGWKKESTDHSMWSNLIDDKGRIRGHIFYKAAFYDRSSHLNLCARYSVRTNDVRNEQRECISAVGIVKDGEVEIHRTESVPADPKRWWECSDEANDAARAWLLEHFPESGDVSAYWD
jgi:hypothetical protein